MTSKSECHLLLLTVNSTHAGHGLVPVHGRAYGTKISFKLPSFGQMLPTAGLTKPWLTWSESQGLHLQSGQRLLARQHLGQVVQQATQKLVLAQPCTLLSLFESGQSLRFETHSPDSLHFPPYTLLPPSFVSCQEPTLDADDV